MVEWQILTSIKIRKLLHSREGDKRVELHWKTITKYQKEKKGGKGEQETKVKRMPMAEFTTKHQSKATRTTIIISSSS